MKLINLAMALVVATSLVGCVCTSDQRAQKALVRAEGAANRAEDALRRVEVAVQRVENVAGRGGCHGVNK